ncbi:MAG: MaoC/PaaZ C-terminal domain-containing protein [Hyphomicrobiaceae bacterium]
MRVEQETIDKFAAATLGHQLICVDAEPSRADSPSGCAIAHGFLMLSPPPKMHADAAPQQARVRMSLNYGFDEIRFLSPVRAGMKDRGRSH